MRIVLYDLQLEPLTILEIPHWRRLRLPEGEDIVIGVQPPLRALPSAGDSVPYEKLPTVRIRFEEIRRKDVRSWFALTSDAETALLLRSAFLPGQQGSLNELQQEQFQRGFLRGFEHALKSV